MENKSGCFPNFEIMTNEDDVLNYLLQNPAALERFIVNQNNVGQVEDWLEKLRLRQAGLLSNNQIENNDNSPNSPLKILNCDFNKVDNRKNHKTEEYIHDGLILRRGFITRIKVQLNRKPVNNEKVCINFETGKKPVAMAETLVELCITAEEKEINKRWMQKNHHSNSNTYDVEIEFIPPSDCIVGRYRVSGTIGTTDSMKKSAKIEYENIAILFNPWCNGDEVFMANDTHRQEYVLNEEGCLFFGTHFRIGMSKWNHGQFEKGILEIILDLLDEDSRYIAHPSKIVQDRRNAVKITRQLTALINCNDDKGVLFGRWDGDYADGSKPTSWNGSVKILRRWNDSGHAPVKYGQCWVFSGVLTTALRCLGIPARSITNFQSAHDSEASITVDEFVDSDGNSMTIDGSSDSVWNFHVWNEAWMQRHDLNKDEDNDGWQACDATPQEESFGLMQCGPVPVKAIKDGRIWNNHDAAFVYAEVNSDRCYWHMNKAGKFELIKRNKNAIGKNISTKAIGQMDREDITKFYKFPEGSEEERQSFDRAYAHGSRPRYQSGQIIPKDGEKFDVEVKFPSDAASKIVGDDFNFEVLVKNYTNLDVKSAVVTVLVHTATDNSVKKYLVKKQRGKDINIPANGKCQINVPIKFDDYKGKLVDHNSFAITATCSIGERLFVDTGAFQLNGPKCVALMVNRVNRANQPMDVFVNIKNPLPCALEHITIELEGFGITGGIWNVPDLTIGPNEEKKMGPLQITPSRRGACVVYADVDTKQIENMKADVQFFCQ